MLHHAMADFKPFGACINMFNDMSFLNAVACLANKKFSGASVMDMITCDKRI